MRRRLQDEGGFTLVELMVTMLLVGIIGSATLAVTTSALRSQRFAIGQRVAMDDSRTAVDRMLKEVRGARRVYDDSTGTRLHVWVDADVDNVQDTSEQVVYEIVPSGGSARLQRSTAADAAGGIPPRTVVFNVDPTSPGFAYTPVPSPTTPTRLVAIELRTAQTGAADAPTVSVSTNVRLRNVE